MLGLSMKFSLGCLYLRASSQPYFITRHSQEGNIVPTMSLKT